MLSFYFSIHLDTIVVKLTGTIITSTCFFPFFIQCRYLSVFWSMLYVGSLPVFILFLQIIVSGLFNCGASSFRKDVCKPSGPGD